MSICCLIALARFQSTPSAWRATSMKSALLMEPSSFQSTPSLELVRIILFQSTPSAWRATRLGSTPVSRTTIFQSTPSAWRATVAQTTTSTEDGDFNPRPPHGGRLRCVLSTLPTTPISIHALRMEGDKVSSSASSSSKISIHALRMEGD